MEQIRIMMYDRESFVFHEYDLLISLETVIFYYCDDKPYLSIQKADGRNFVINKDYVMALQIEEAD
ncbi:hypothetical protein [Staphylococcus sp. LKG3-3]|uniref:hypothetical protein n=1 Tax=Staphylococcus sp. LKG3-3 TaxID=3399685 RepID=UPI003D50F2F8